MKQKRRGIFSHPNLSFKTILSGEIFSCQCDANLVDGTLQPLQPVWFASQNYDPFLSLWYLSPVIRYILFSYSFFNTEPLDSSLQSEIREPPLDRLQPGSYLGLCILKLRNVPPKAHRYRLESDSYWRLQLMGENKKQ